MDTHDEPGARRAGEPLEADAHDKPHPRTTDDADSGHSHPAGPSTPDSGFAEGVDHKPDQPEEDQEPDFARGIRQLPDDAPDVQGKFSRGAEQLPEDAADKTVERRFSEGIEQLPHDQ